MNHHSVTKEWEMLLVEASAVDSMPLLQLVADCLVLLPLVSLCGLICTILSHCVPSISQLVLTALYVIPRKLSLPAQLPLVPHRPLVPLALQHLLPLAPQVCPCFLFCAF